MANEHKYSVQMNFELGEQLSSKTMSQCLEDAMLLYTAKTGQKFRAARLSVYDDIMTNIALPDFRKEDIGDAPTVDAVKVAHGQCEKSVMKNEWYGHIYTCKECKYQCMVDDGTGNDIEPNCCPNCGVRYMEVTTNEKDHIRAH